MARSYVARRSVQVGQRVAPGNPLMAIVPLDGVWADANFNEVQLTPIRSKRRGGPAWNDDMPAAG